MITQKYHLTSKIRARFVGMPQWDDHVMQGWKTKPPVGAQFRTVPVGAMSSGFAGISHGLIAGTHVASNLGWRAVDAICVGDKVLTFDNAMQVVQEIRRDILWLDASDAPERMWPITVPVGAMGNRSELSLLPDQGLLVESDAVSDAQGDPFAVVPALALEGVRGIYRAKPHHQIEVITLFFENDEVIYVEGGSLVYCPHLGCLVSDVVDQTPAPYDVLPASEAAALVECMCTQDNLAGERDWQALETCVA